MPNETGWRVGGHPTWLHTLVGLEATAYIIDPSHSDAGAEAIPGLDYDGNMIHDGWSPYDQFEKALHQQCLNHLLRGADEMAATAARGAVCFPRRVAELLLTGLYLRDRYAAGEIGRHGLAVASGRLENQLVDLTWPPKTNAANERLAQHLWNHRNDLFTFLRQPWLDATNWRAELAILFGVTLCKVWGGSRTWTGASAVDPDVGVADVLAARTFGSGLPQSTPTRRAGDFDIATLSPPRQPMQLGRVFRHRLPADTVRQCQL